MNRSWWILLSTLALLLVGYIGSYFFLREVETGANFISFSILDTVVIVDSYGGDGTFERINPKGDLGRYKPAGSETQGYFLSCFFSPIWRIEALCRLED